MTSADIKLLQQKALKVIQPISAANSKTVAPEKFLFEAVRTKAGKNLPPYYLVYFLLVDLLKFHNLGQWEKTAWSVPIDFNGKAFLIEHRKLGLGIFAIESEENEKIAEKIAQLIKRGVKIAEPYFEYRAEEAVKDSKLNVNNNSYLLYQRFEFFLNLYKHKLKELNERKEERHVTKKGATTEVYFPSFELTRESKWLALAAIDSFFSWTEHVFIHLALLQENIMNASQVADLADADWQQKFKTVLDLNDKTTKVFFDELVIIKRQLRNYIAHGAFGKNGEAFQFHSGAGAAPVLLPHLVGKNRFKITGMISFNEAEAIKVIEDFIVYFWSEEREPAKLYIQDSGIPLIIPLVNDGTYRRAMSSPETMKEFLDGLTAQFDRAANMDW